MVPIGLGLELAPNLKWWQCLSHTEAALLLPKGAVQAGQQARLLTRHASMPQCTSLYHECAPYTFNQCGFRGAFVCWHYLHAPAGEGETRTRQHTHHGR